MGTGLPGTENPGIEKVLRRGTAEILERDDDGIFLFDTVSEAYMISSTDSGKAEQWILRHSDRNYKLLVAAGDYTADPKFTGIISNYFLLLMPMGSCRTGSMFPSAV